MFPFSAPAVVRYRTLQPFGWTFAVYRFSFSYLYVFGSGFLR
jgi:hypothetical protein